MKRITKISLILIAMVLIFGSVFAIFANAADDTAGITILGSANIESVTFDAGKTEKTYLDKGTYTGSQYPTIGGQQFQINKVGTLKVLSGVNNDGTANKYVFYTPNGTTGNSAYSTYSMKNNISSDNSADKMVAKLTATQNNISRKMDGNAFIFDVDIASSENYGKFPYNARIQLIHSYLYDNAGTNTYATMTPELVIKPKYEGSTEAVLTLGSNSCVIDATKWNHITISSYIVKAETSYSIYAAVWVNGEYKFTTASITGLKYFVVEGTKHAACAMLHARFLLIGENRVEPYAGIAMDNTSYRMVDLATNTTYADILNNGKDLTGWGGNLYNEDTMPKSLPTVAYEDTTNGFYYVNSAGSWVNTTSLSTAIANAKAYSTIHMVGDNTVTFASSNAKINMDNKNLALDLGGNTLTFLPNNQSGIFLSNNTTFTILNGELRSTQAPGTTYANKNFALFWGGTETVTLNLDNVDTYVGQLACGMNWNGKHCFNININGGFHSAETQGYCHVVGGFVESRIQMNFKATDATFFFNNKTWLVTQFYRWKDNAPKKSTFDFTRCTIIDDPTNTSTWGAIRFANEYAFFTFNDCDINAEINPVGHSSNDWVYDSATGNYSTSVKYNPITAANIIFGEGTRYSSTKEMMFTPAQGYSTVSVNESESYAFKSLNTTTPATEFTFADKTCDIAYNVVIGVSTDPAFEYVSSGVTLYTDDLAIALSGADEGTTIKLLKDHTYTGPTDGDANQNETLVIATVSRSITIDLNKNTLTILQPEQNTIQLTKSITVTNGTLRAARSSTDWTKDYTYPVFYVNANNISVTLEDVNTYAGCIAYAYDKSNWTVNVEGGEHYITNASQGTLSGGWVSSRTAATLNASDAKFYISGSGALISATSFKLASTAANLESNFNFTTCDIISENKTVSIIPYANVNTNLSFVNCNIDACINPTVWVIYDSKTGNITNADYVGTTSEIWGPMAAGSIYFSSGTRYNSEKPLIGGDVVVVEDGYELVENAYKTTIKFSPTSNAPYTDNFATTPIDRTSLFDMTVCNLDDYKVQYTISKKSAYTNDFFYALKNTDTSTAVTLLKDVELESPTEVGVNNANEVAYALYRDITINLGGHTLTVWQHIQWAIRIGANDPITLTVENGTIATAKDNNQPYPFFYLVGKNPTLKLNNVNTYNTYIYNNVAGSTVDIEGGTHVAIQAPGGAQGRSWLMNIVNINFTANDATFFNDSSAGIISSHSRNQLSTIADSVFTFNGCTFVEDPIDKGEVRGTHGSSTVYGQGVIWYANENSKFNFNDCDIHAAINPQRYWDSASFSDFVKNPNDSNDKSTLWGAIQPGSIYFGIGTRYDGSYTVAKELISVADGYALGGISETSTITILDGADSTVVDGVLNFAREEREITLSLTVGVVYPQGYKIMYTSGKNVNYGNDLIEALKAADSGSIVYLQSNYTINNTTATENIYTIYKNLTIDLGGNILSVYQEWQNYIGIGANVTFKNGEIRNVRSSEIEEIVVGKNTYKNEQYNDKSHPILRFAKAGVTLTLENIKSYSGAFIYNYQYSDVVVNVIGGEHHITHHLTSGAQGSLGGFVENRGSMTFTATGALFFSDRSGWVVTSLSSYDNVTSHKDGSTTIYDTHAPKGATFTFNDCKLISDAEDNDGNFHLVMYANQFTKIYLNNSLVYGSINPTVANTDKDKVNDVLWGSMPASNLVFGEGTRLVSSIKGYKTVFMGNSFANENLMLIDETETLVLSINECNDRPYSEGYIFTSKTLKLAFDKVVADNVNITVTFHYPDGTTVLEHFTLGDIITDFPTYEIPSNVNNGWVKIIYDGGWSTEGFGKAIDELTVTGRIHLYPSAESARAYMTSAMYNLSLYGNVGVNLLIPDENNVPDGIILWDVYDTNGNLITNYKTGIVGEGLTYNSYEVGKSSVLSLNNSIIGRVCFSYNNVEFVQTITLNPYNYVVKIMTDADSNPKSVTLLADMVRYATELNQFANRDGALSLSTFDAEITVNGEKTTLKALSNKLTSTLTLDSSFTNGEKGTFAANDYISAISFDLGGADPSYVVYFKDGVKVVDVEFIMDDAYLNTLAGYNRGKLVYGIDKSLSTYVEGTNYLSMAHSTGISIYNIDNFIKIRLTVISELGARRTITCEGSYNLNNYYSGITADGVNVTADDIARAKDVLLALRSFATSTIDYRYDVNNAGETRSNKVALYYEDFGAVADGVTDDYAAIYEAHARANELKAEGRDVTVYAIKPDGVIPAGSTFFIDNTYEAAEYYCKSAVIKTDVDWTGANFVINDYALFEGSDSNNPSYVKVERATNQAFYTPLFIVAPDTSLTSTDYFYRQITFAKSRQILATDTEIPEIASLALPFDTALVYVQNSKHRNYVRYGANAGSSVQAEIVLVDTKTGKIDPSTPLATDFTDVSYINVYNADEEAITIEGGNFEVLYNRVNSYSYTTRGIDVRRSNVTIQNVVQDYTYSTYNEQVSGGAPMHQFFGTSRTHGLTIKDCIIEGPKVFYDVDNGDGTGTIMRGSYTIRADFASSFTVSGIKQTNLYTDGDRGAVDNIADHHAVMGSNYCKNFFFLDNKMSTFDSHTGIHNLIVDNCEVERINVIGSGTVIVEDTLIHTGVTHSAITLREDYNSHFNGDVYFRNVTLETYDFGYAGLFWMSFLNYNTGLYYTDGYTWTTNGVTYTDSYHAQDTTKGGDDSKYYTSYLPQNVYIEGLTVLAGGKVVTDPTNELGGVYTRGRVATAGEVDIALYNGYDTAVTEVHEWKCDISTQGDYFETREWDWSKFGYVTTRFTVNHPIKPTEKVENDSIYTINDYVFKGTIYNNLEFLNNLVVENK